MSDKYGIDRPSWLANDPMQKAATLNEERYHG
jgi:hypothetical protein